MSDQELNEQIVPMTEEELRERTMEMRTGKRKMRREGCYWSPEEDELVEYKFYVLFESTTQIAIEHERQESAIIQRINYLAAQRYGNLKRPNQKKKLNSPPGCLCKDCTLDRSFCPRCIHYHGNQEEA